MGANEVIPEEFETSVEIFTRVLIKYGISLNDIKSFIAEIRSDGYGPFRNLVALPESEKDLKFYLPDIEISAVLLESASPFVGKSLKETDMRVKYGVTIVSIQRDEQTISNPDGKVILLADDVLVLMGKIEAINEAASQCAPEEKYN